MIEELTPKMLYELLREYEGHWRSMGARGFFKMWNAWDKANYVKLRIGDPDMSRVRTTLRWQGGRFVRPKELQEGAITVEDGKAYYTVLENAETPADLVRNHPPSVWHRHEKFGEEGWTKQALTSELGEVIGVEAAEKAAESVKQTEATQDAQHVAEDAAKAEAKWWHKCILNDKGMDAAKAGEDLKMMEHVHPLKAAGWVAIPAGIAYLMSGKKQQPDALITDAQLESQLEQANEQGPALH